MNAGTTKRGETKFSKYSRRSKRGEGGRGHDFLLKVSGGKTLEETMKLFFPWISQLAIPGSKLTIETLEQGVNYVFKLTIKTPEGRSGAFIVNF